MKLTVTVTGTPVMSWRLSMSRQYAYTEFKFHVWPDGTILDWLVRKQPWPEGESFARLNVSPLRIENEMDWIVAALFPEVSASTMLGL
jgi:hypothetical protein